MQKALSFLIIFGLVVWMFLLVLKHQPEMLRVSPREKIDDANTSSRCAQYGRDVEGERAMGYGDRIRQFLAGCW